MFKTQKSKIFIGLSAVAALSLVMACGQQGQQAAPAKFVTTIPDLEVSSATGNIVATPAPPPSQNRSCAKNKKYAQTFKARNLTKAELSAIKELPMFTRAQAKSKNVSSKSAELIGLGEANKSTRDGIPYNENRQVLFAVDVEGLPAKTSILSEIQLSLNLNLLKNEKLKSGSQSLCLIDKGVCSGKISPVNYLFLENWERPINNNFSTDYERAKVRHSKDKNITYAKPLEFALADFLEGAPEGLNPMSLLYGTSGSEEPRTLYFVVADSLYVQSAELKVLFLLSEQACAVAEESFQLN